MLPPRVHGNRPADPRRPPPTPADADGPCGRPRTLWGVTTGAARQRLALAAREALDLLRSAAPDTGDDVTQLALDDALDAIEDRLALLAEGGETR